MPVQPSYDNSPASYLSFPPAPRSHSQSRPSSMYATPAPAMSRGNSGGLFPNGYPPQGYYDVPPLSTPHHGYAGRSRSHSRPPPPGVGVDFSQPPVHPRPRSHSRNYSDSYSYPRPEAVPEQFVRLGVPADSPWYPPPVPPQPVGYENVGHEPMVSPTYPSAGYGAPYGAYPDYAAHYGYSHPRARSRSMRGSDRSTPWQGGGYLPPLTPGGVSDQLPDHLAEDYGRVARPERGRVGNIDTRWMAGRGCQYHRRLHLIPKLAPDKFEI